jgi:hypothetical protein
MGCTALGYRFCLHTYVLVGLEAGCLETSGWGNVEATDINVDLARFILGG